MGTKRKAADPQKGKHTKRRKHADSGDEGSDGDGADADIVLERTASDVDAGDAGGASDDDAFAGDAAAVEALCADDDMKDEETSPHSRAQFARSVIEGTEDDLGCLTQRDPTGTPPADGAGDDTMEVIGSAGEEDADEDDDGLTEEGRSIISMLFSKCVANLEWSAPSKLKKTNIRRLFASIAGLFGSPTVIFDPLPPWDDPRVPPSEHNNRERVGAFLGALPYVSNDNHRKRYTGSQKEFERSMVRFSLGCNPDDSPLLYAALDAYMKGRDEAMLREVSKLLALKKYHSAEGLKLYLEGVVDEKGEEVESRNGFFAVTKGKNGVNYVEMRCKVYQTAEEKTKGIMPEFTKIVCPRAVSDDPEKAFAERPDGTIDFADITSRWEEIQTGTRFYAAQVTLRGVNIMDSGKGKVNEGLYAESVVMVFPQSMVRALHSKKSAVTLQTSKFATSSGDDIDLGEAAPEENAPQA